MRTGSVRKSDLENKYIFWDIDGTLAPYRFNDHVSDPEGTNNGMSLKEISEHIFLTRKPSQHMMKVVYSCGARRNFIMGHCQVQQEMDDKQLWLDKYFTIIRRQDRILTFENISKADSIVEYCAGHRIDLKDAVYVDDVLVFLREAERKGIKSYHISSFLDWDYSDDYFNSKDAPITFEECEVVPDDSQKIKEKHILNAKNFERFFGKGKV
jgi:FMN phosphatase YigB (HAD superfamily)